MLLHYFKAALRNLLRHRFFSAINVFGLAVAMSICMTIIMLVADQMSYDRYNTNAERIYRVTTIDLDEKGEVMTYNPINAACPMPAGHALMSKYTGVEKSVRFRGGFGNGWFELENQNVNIPLAGFFADADALTFFQYELQYGDAATALKDPFTVVLTRKAVNKLFKEENPVGKTIQVGDLGLYTVTGVLKESENKSHIVFDALASMASATSLERSGKLRSISDSWIDAWQSWTYILVEKDKTVDDIQQSLDGIFDEHIRPITKPGIHKVKFGLQHLLAITPGDILNNSIGPQLPWELVYFLGGLALVILLTSCFNFTNLSIARSLTRAREIGVRKVTGAARWQIFTQFISESVLISMVALAMAVLLLFILKPMVLQMSFAQMLKWDLYSDVTVYSIFIMFACVVGLLAGFFPAVVLSGFQPIKVLKSLNNVKLFSRMGLRKGLLVAQFTLSLFFILTVIVINNQLDLFTHQDHGFNMKNNVLVRLNTTPFQTLKTELQKYNNITSVTAVSHVPAAGTTYGAGIKKNMEDPIMVDANFFLVDEDYINNMHLKLLAGKFFAADQAKKDFVVINESAAKKLNYGSIQDAVGESMLYANDSTNKTIIGVVADYNHRDLSRQISPLILLYEPESFKALQVAYNGTYAGASQSIEKAWATVSPGTKADYTEVESEINKFYELVFGDLVNVLGFVSFLAILISCLGLLGMSTYATETRIKEISIRKVLGASGAGLVILLTRGFLGVLGLAVIIGVPLSYFVNDLWLSTIAYRTSISVGVIGISVLILLFFGIVTVGSQTIRATFVKPVDNLKNE